MSVVDPPARRYSTRATTKGAPTLLILIALAVAQSSCSGSTTLKFAESAGLSNPPAGKIPLWVEVTDLTDSTGIEDSFQAQMEFHDLSPDLLSARVAVALTPDEFRYTGTTGYKHRIENPFTVVDDSDEAELLLRISVTTVGYGTREAVAPHKHGILTGLADHPQAFLEVVCQLRKPPEAAVRYEFDAIAISDATGKRGRALKEAIDIAAEMIIKKLVEPTTGY